LVESVESVKSVESVESVKLVKSSMMTRLSKFFSLPGSDKRLFLEALYWLVIAKALLIFLPFKRILPMLKQKESIQTGKADPAAIRDAIGRAATTTPWTSTCLMKSMAARWMLKRRKTPSHMGIGMMKDERGKLVMHAWVGVQGFEVISKDVSYRDLYHFE